MWSTCCLCHTVQLVGVKYGSCFASSLGSLAGEPGNEATSSLVSRPLPNLPPFQERPGTHCLRMHKIFHYIFHKKLLCTFLSICWRLYRVFFELDSGDLTCIALLGYLLLFRCGSIIFPNIQSNRNKHQTPCNHALSRIHETKCGITYTLGPLCSIKQHMVCLNWRLLVLTRTQSGTPPQRLTS